MLFRYRFFIISIVIISYSSVKSQTTVNYLINTSLDRHVISPLIYGINGQNYSKAKAVRSGGNRMTGYNWETNASHAGEDWFNNNDDYLPWSMGLPEFLRDSTAIVLSRFQEDANSKNQYTLQTLPMAGYVSADKDGIVEESEVAPSVRWNQVINNKSTGLTLSPDLNDGKVYIDEEINFMINKYNNAQSATGINAYSLDNEPGLWVSTHPRIHPEKVRVDELLSSSTALATTIKRMDDKASVFGPALYGFNAFVTLQDAPDWQSIWSSDHDWFIDAYLAHMDFESKKVNLRLLDVLDIHWYPEPSGVYAGDTNRVVSENRMQSVRSLWDSSYVEDSWIGQWFSPVALIPRLKYSIDTYFPNTKLGITEYDYAGNTHISGAIAQADALGVFGEQGVYFASKWNNIDGFVRSAFDLFLDYNNSGGQFGEMGVSATTSDVELSTIYSAYEMSDSNRLHIIMTNKSYDEDIDAVLQIESPMSYLKSEAYIITRGDTIIQQLADMNLISNKLEFTMPSLSVMHLVLKDVNTDNVENEMSNDIDVFPNPANNIVQIVSKNNIIKQIEIFDIPGQLIQTIESNNNNVIIDISKLEMGNYYVKIHSLSGVVNKRIVVVR